MFSKVIHTFLDILFPLSCVGCGDAGSMVCQKCSLELEYRGRECFFCGVRGQENNLCQKCKAAYPLEGIVWAWRYQNDKTKHIIGRLKYGKRRSLAPALALSISQALTRAAWPVDFIAVAIPLHTEKERERGFNQAELLARSLGIPLAPRATLIRRKNTPSQARTHSRRERFQHMKGAFAVQKPGAVAGKNILLVDDVATTGATLCEAAKVLKKSGAAKIYAAVIAHG